MAEAVHLTTRIPDDAAASMAGHGLSRRHYDRVFRGGDYDVYTPDGRLLFKLRHEALTAGACHGAFEPAKRAARPSFNRGDAAGPGRHRKVKRDGTLSGTLVSPAVLSGLAGFYDASKRLPYCRATEFTANQLERWGMLLPMVREADGVFRREVPDRYESQMRAVRRTSPEFVIGGTAFTTVTLNRNYATRVHKDRGDLREGFGVITVLRAGCYDGCYLVFPQYRVAVDLWTRDVLLADVHEWHGNTEFASYSGRYDRVSAVMYYREGMKDCGTAAHELARAWGSAGAATHASKTASLFTARMRTLLGPNWRFKA